MSESPNSWFNELTLPLSSLYFNPVSTMATPLSSSPTHNQGLNECRESESDTPPPELPILPHEIIVEILSRLPVKTLIKLRCVCKSFKTLISCPKFIKTHLKNVETLSKTNPSDFSGRLLTKTWDEKITFQSWSIHSIFSSPEADVRELDCADLNPDGSGWRLVGSCNGLLCFTFDSKDVILWNPTTRVINILPSLPEESIWILNHFGFGYDGEMDDYVVVALLASLTKTPGGGRRQQFRVKVYTLKTQCWKGIEDFEYEFLYGPAVHVKGNLCWTVHTEYNYEPRHAIVALDLAKQTFKEVLQPDYEEAGDGLSLSVLNASLCAMCNYEGIGADIWIMMEFGLQESWTKMFHIPYLEYTDEYFHSSLICIYDGGEVLLDFDEGFGIYNPNVGTFRYPKINYSYFNDVYIESLVSPFGGTNHHL